MSQRNRKKTLSIASDKGFVFGEIGPSKLQTKIRLLQEKSGLGLHCLLFPLQPLEAFPTARHFLFKFKGSYREIFDVKKFRFYSTCVSVIYEPRCEKTGRRGFRPGPTQTRLYSHRRWLEA